MKTNMHKNSLDAYTDLIESGTLNNQQKKIVNALHYTSNVTREEIALLTGIKESSVCGRIRELIDSKIVVAAGTKKTLSGTKADALALADKYKH